MGYEEPEEHRHQANPNYPTVIIFQDKPDNWQYHAPTQELRNYGRPGKKIVCVSAALYVFDVRQGAMIEIPVSRGNLVEIGLGCVMAALRR